MEEIRHQELIEEKKLEHQRLTVLLQCTPNDSATYGQLADKEHKAYIDLMRQINRQAPVTQASTAQQLMAAWSKEFGDFDSPDTQRKIDAVAQGLQQATVDSRKKRRRK